MYILAAGIVILLIVLAGADLFLAQFNADELSNMGVEKPWQIILKPMSNKPGGYRIIQPGIFFIYLQPTDRSVVFFVFKL